MPYLLTRYPLDDLYLGPDEDIEYVSVSSGSPDVLAAMPGKYIHSSGSRITMHAHSPHADQSPASKLIIQVFSSIQTCTSCPRMTPSMLMSCQILLTVPLVLR